MSWSRGGWCTALAVRTSSMGAISRKSFALSCSAAGLTTGGSSYSTTCTIHPCHIIITTPFHTRGEILPCDVSSCCVQPHTSQIKLAGEHAREGRNCTCSWSPVSRSELSQTLSRLAARRTSTSALMSWHSSGVRPGVLCCGEALMCTDFGERYFASQ